MDILIKQEIELQNIATRRGVTLFAPPPIFMEKIGTTLSWLRSSK